jgi:hypothetical protein
MFSLPLGLMGQVWVRKSLVGAPPNKVGVHGCHHLLESFVEALRFIPSRLLVLQLPPRFVLSTLGVGVAAVVFFFAAATWLLADTSSSS